MQPKVAKKYNEVKKQSQPSQSTAGWTCYARLIQQSHRWCDYAEFFEWLNKNTNAEDRVGYFVTLDNDKIRIADTEDYIIGIVSGSPSIVGNSPEDWAGRWKKDKFGRLIKEISKIPLTTYEEYDEPIFDENGQETGEYEHKMREIETGEYMELEHPVTVDEYDSSLPYISRADRPKWDAIGMFGMLAVYDDGSC